MTDDKAIEAAARAMCKADGTAQCTAICLSHFSTSTTGGQCPEAMRVWGRKVRAALAEADKVRAEGFFHFVIQNGSATVSTPAAEEFARRAFAAGLAKGDAERAALVEALEPFSHLGCQRRNVKGFGDLEGFDCWVADDWVYAALAALALVRKGV